MPFLFDMIRCNKPGRVPDCSCLVSVGDKFRCNQSCRVRGVARVGTREGPTRLRAICFCSFSSAACDVASDLDCCAMHGEPGG